MPDGLPQSVTFRDAKGHTAVMRCYVNNDSVPANERTRGLDFANDVAALSNAVVESAKGPYTTISSPASYGAAAVYASVEDKAVLTFQDANGGLHRFAVPAPKASIFLADGETVDPANTDIVALETQVISELKTRDGVGFIGMPGGIRKRVKIRRKETIFTLDPTLSIPDE